ncbi:hypothetical protein GBA65_07715 [Rubrobacter marinus]|uniref:NADH-quinone oxidoreductase subunit J n=1 Tax=Rubrobacter marinus TaxID=2653852 RepID=A0A6G8PW48_9ACTN|nr:NADH-quinone oxidoreductase subunit J [Rubrobacter marinus]QIN78430.1 hypothetical protein GBA65_07715 [Rubrobacter marinus]
MVILFGIMFTQKPQARRFGAIFNGQLWPGVLVAAGVGAFLVYVVSAQGWAGKAPGNGPRDAAELGRILLGVAGGGSEVFALLFVLASVLLMVALVAAIVISYRKHAPASPEEDDVFVGRDRTASREEGALDGLPGPASPPEGSPPLVHRDS